MPQLPDSIGPAVKAIVKHHFWLLAAVVPLVLLPLVLVAQGGMQSRIAGAQGQVNSKLSSLRGVQGIAPHPNEKWCVEIDADAARLRGETLQEWEKFWASQADLRVWPPELGDDFLRDVAALKPDGRLEKNLLQRYQRKAPDLVRKLPGRMGADDAMGNDEGAAQTQPGPEAGGARSRNFVSWDADDQRKLLRSFEWQKLPGNLQAATTLVLLAQEDLWVYGLLCDAVARANKGAINATNAAIVAVRQVTAGYPAAQANPGAAGGRRIVMPKSASAPGMEAFTPLPDSEGLPIPGMPAANLTKPPHFRFGGGPAGPLPGAESIPGIAGTPAAAPDASLREWIYVDFDGRPLSAAELATSPAARMVHLVPFVMRIVIDQRRLDAFLVDLATAAVPIDVREVRINVPSEGRQAGGGAAGDGRQRPHDVEVELRGTVGLATPPSAAAIGIEPVPAAEPAAADRRDHRSPPARREQEQAA